MTAFLVGLVLVAAAVVTLQRGATWAFAWVLIPAFILVPPGIELDLGGLPEISPRRAACLGILAGMALQRRLLRLLPRVGVVDAMVIAAVVWFSISFGLLTDLKGFGHKLIVFAMDWLLPYLFARSLMRDIRSLRIVIGPLAICVAIHGVVALYEARMAVRVGLEFWQALTGIPVPGHFLRGGAWRWGYLRAFGFFNHPINVGVLFATLLPLVPLWGLLQRKRLPMMVAAAAGLAGLVATFSRGPMLSFVGASSLYAALAYYRTRVVLALGVVALIAVSPFAIELVSESLQHTQRELEERGNVESGYYRLALFMIYGQRISEVGWFGDPSIVATEYAAAWSLDNAYLYLFIVGGWGGGGLMLAIVLHQLLVAFRSVARTSGRRRRIRACIGASFTSIAVCMINIWFSPDYAPFLFIVSALVTNSSLESFFLGGELEEDSSTRGAELQVGRIRSEARTSYYEAKRGHILTNPHESLRKR